MTFSTGAWQAVAARYDQILAHPFVVALGDGSLPHEVFVRYLVDDAHYLLGYARVLALLASRMTDADAVADLAGASVGAVVAERALHRGFLAPLGIDPDAPGTPGPTVTCRAYTGFLAEQAATAPAEVGLAAVLPCFRVYAEVGRHLEAARGGRAHPYADWIETYADPEFDAAVARAEQLTDRLAATSPHTAAMLDAYRTATELEWRFWDEAWRGPDRSGGSPG
ncbi:TenA family protein [Nocardioides nanhaiensis]|uniref:Thiaminase II n=1 Tax=Nocardioides nanhaiensis TaxID=1476871 RepID=A0ABP8VWN3_9ACTN